MDPLTYIVSESTAQQILATFGITALTPTYERRVRPDGFRLCDLSEVLSDSPFVLVMDWRGFLDDFVNDALLPALVELDCPLEYEALSEQANEGALSSPGGGGEIVRYAKAGDPFDPVIHACQRLVPPGIEFRRDPGNDGSDCWNYAVLPRDEWRDLERLDSAVVRSLFVPLAAGSTA